MTKIARDLIERKEVVDCDESTLKYRLRTYRSNVSKLQLVAPHRPAFADDAADHIERSLQELDALENLYSVQIERIQRGLEEEDQAGTSSPHVDRQIALAVNILNKRHSIKMDLGFAGKDTAGSEIDPDTIKGAESTYGESVAKALSVPKHRARVLSLARKMGLLSDGDEA